MSDQARTPLLTMRGWTHNLIGAPEKVLSLSSEVARPSLKSATQVLVRVYYAALNPGGSVMMQLCPSFLRTKPYIPEMDFAGEIVQVDETLDSSRGLKPGLEVFGTIPVPDHLKGQGSLSEYVVVEASCVVPVPKGMALDQAAGLAIAGCTALALLDRAKLERGQKVLVNGAAGGIGSMITQLARDAVGDEGYIVAVCSADKEDLMKDLGVNEVIDRRRNSPVGKFLAEKYSDGKFDVVLDAYGVQEMVDHCASFLKESGPFVTVGIAFEAYTYGSMLVAVSRMLKNALWPRLLGGPSRKYIQVASFVDLEGLERLSKYGEAGKLRVPIDSVWGLDDVLKAYERMLSKGAKGKIVVKVQDRP